MATTLFDNTPFTWGQGGEKLTPDQIKNRRAVVDAMIKNGTDASPIRHWSQGANRVAQALLGGLEARQLDQAEKANTAEDRTLARAGIAAILGGGSTTPAADVPAAGSGPASLNSGASVPSFVAATGGQPTAAFTPVSGDLSARKQLIMQGLVQRGLSPNAAAAYAGNFAVENNADPVGAVGDNGTAFGMAQWRKERFDALKQLASSQGKDWRDINVQLDHVMREHNAMPEGYRNALASADPTTGASLVMRHYERPSDAAMAQSGAKRAQMALAAFNGFKPAGVAPASPASPAGAGGDVQDDPSIPANGPATPLAYKAPAATPVNPNVAAVADALRVQREGGPRMVLSPQNPAVSPADIPASGVQPASFYVPPAQSGGQPTTVPSSDDAQSGRVKVAQALVGQRQAAPADRGAAIADMLSSPAASDNTRKIAALLLQKEMDDRNRGQWIERTLDDGSIVQQNSHTREIKVIRPGEKPAFGVIGKDEFGREQYGFINAYRGTTSPAQAPAGAQPSSPSAIPPTPAGVDPKQWREAWGKKLAEDATGPKPDEVSSLRKEVQQLPSYKNIAQAVPIYRSMVETAGRNSKASDLNLVYGLGKIMDPGSVVREGEMVMVRNTAALPEWLQGAINQLNGGAALTPETRRQIMTEAHGRMQGYQQQFALDTSMYGGIADRAKMNRADIIPDFGEIKPWAPQSSAGTGATSPAPQRGQVARPTSQADFDALPRGAPYIDPDDGITYRKP